MIGDRFNRLTVVRQDTDRKDKTRKYWMCLCECGRFVSVRNDDLKSGKVKSCGCLKSESASSLMTTHGESRTKLYRIWSSMIARCYNPEVDRYYRYGGRGILVCVEWRHNYPAFRDWALSHGYHDGLSLDRIALDGDYTPENCRWISKAEQMKNTSTNRYLTYNGETLILSDWARKVGITPATLSKRLKRGWTLERALSPVRISVK